MTAHIIRTRVYELLRQGELKNLLRVSHLIGCDYSNLHAAIRRMERAGEITVIRAGKARPLVIKRTQPHETN